MDKKEVVESIVSFLSIYFFVSNFVLASIANYHSPITTYQIPLAGSFLPPPYYLHRLY